MTKHEYVDQEKLQDDMDELEQFILNELEVEETDSALMLLNRTINRIQITRQRQMQNQGNNANPSPNDSASYIG